MAKNSKKADIDLSELASDAGLTILQNSDHAVVTDVLPLFLPKIDKLFGGGLPFGRMVELAGKPSSGKCLTKESKVLTSTGYKTVEEIINEQGLEAVTATKEVPAEVELINRYGEKENTSHIHFNGKLRVNHIKTRTGLEQKVTENHPLLVIDPYGIHVWKQADELEEGDFLVTRRGDNVFGNKTLDFNTAYSLGALVADGSFQENRLNFTNNDPYLLFQMKTFFKKIFGVDYKTYYKGNSEDIRITNTEEVNKFYSMYNLSSGIAKNKQVPEVIMQSTKETQIAFIQGYMDCESSIDKSSVEVTSASKLLLQQIQLMLKNMGIISFVKEKKVTGYEHNYYGRLSMYGKDVKDYIDKVGFKTPRRDTSSIYEKVKGKHSNHDFIPYSLGLVKSYYKSTDINQRKTEYNTLMKKGRDVSRKNIQRFLDELDDDPYLHKVLTYANRPEFYYDEITSVEDAGSEPTFDFTMPKTHSFVAESIVNHNSTLTYHSARVATNLNCIVVLIDVEGTADRHRLSHLGIDVSKVMVKQPDPDSGIRLTVEEIGRTVEQTLEVFKESYPDTPIIFIWDSVGQTPSEVELDKEYGEQNVGARAKAISQFVTKVAPQISNSKSLLLGINQVRDDIGGNPMFPTYSVPGGNQWEHYASLRLEIKQKKAIKKGEEKIGHIMGVNVRKSKVSKPFQADDGYLISNNGIDYEYNLSFMASEAGIIGGTSQSFSYIDTNGEEHKSKKDDFIEWLRTEDAQPIREEILNRLIEYEFPEGYPALSNKNLSVDGWIDQVYKPAEMKEETQNSTSAEESEEDLNKE